MTFLLLLTVKDHDHKIKTRHDGDFEKQNKNYGYIHPRRDRRQRRRNAFWWYFLGKVESFNFFKKKKREELRQINKTSHTRCRCRSPRFIYLWFDVSQLASQFPFRNSFTWNCWNFILCDDYGDNVHIKYHVRCSHHIKKTMRFFCFFCFIYEKKSSFLDPGIIKVFYFITGWALFFVGSGSTF